MPRRRCLLHVNEPCIAWGAALQARLHPPDWRLLGAALSAGACCTSPFAFLQSPALDYAERAHPARAGGCETSPRCCRRPRHGTVRGTRPVLAVHGTPCCPAVLPPAAWLCFRVPFWRQASSPSMFAILSGIPDIVGNDPPQRRSLDDDPLLQFLRAKVAGQGVCG